MRKRKSDAARADDENPEWTRDEMRRAVPALKAISAAFGPKAADALRKKRGRPAKPDRKVNQTLRLDADVIEAYREEGRGWQARINRILRENMHGSRK